MRAPDFWYEESSRGRVVAALLSPLGALYDCAGRLKQSFARPFDPGIPVICVGNLTAGGTGKTPLTIMLAKHFAARGRRPFVLTRGYGGALKGPLLVELGTHTAEDVGDEALLIARTVPTIVARDRRAGARFATERHADVLLMDDGFQNFTLKKSLSILVVDGTAGFGNGRVLPAGPLREGIARGLKRAGAIVFMGTASQRTSAAVRAFAHPKFNAVLVPDGSALPPGPLFAFAGIGRPQKFFASLAALGHQPIAALGFPDHHPYTEAEIGTLRADAAKAGAHLVTTEKDLVRLKPNLAQGIAALPVSTAIIEAAAFSELLAGI